MAMASPGVQGPGPGHDPDGAGDRARISSGRSRRNVATKMQSRSPAARSLASE